MKVLVTGAAGFIGSNLSEYLISQGHHVMGVDNFTPNYPRALKWRNLTNLLTDPNFEFQEADVKDRAVMEEAEPDAVIHLAALAGVQKSMDNPETYMRENVEGTTAILEAASLNGVDKVLVASSSSVYGHLGWEGPCMETYAGTAYAASPYAASKRAMEEVAAYYRLNDWIPQLSVMRFFTVYGPRQRPDMGIHKFFLAAYQGEVVNVFDGESKRDYTYIDDITSGIHSILEDSPGRPYNLGSGNPVTLNELLDAIEEVTGKVIRRQQHTLQDGDVLGTWADTHRASEDLDWKPRVSLMEGLQKYDEWFRRCRNNR